jgi:anti-anti-sigma factor
MKHMTSPESVTVHKKNGYLWVRLPAALTGDSVLLCDREIMQRLSESENRVVVDCENAADIYSSGIGFLVRLRKKTGELNGMFCMVNVPAKIRSQFESMHLDKVFPMYATDVEFELSQDGLWKDKLSEDLGFVFVAQLEGGAYRINLSGHMDALHDLSPVSEFVPEKPVSCYLFNLEALDMMDTYGSQVFLELVQRARERGGRCIAYGANEMVRELLKILSIDGFLDIVDNERDALDASGS